MTSVRRRIAQAWAWLAPILPRTFQILIAISFALIAAGIWLYLIQGWIADFPIGVLGALVALLIGGWLFWTISAPTFWLSLRSVDAAVKRWVRTRPRAIRRMSARELQLLGLLLALFGAALWWLDLIRAFRADRPWYQEAAALVAGLGIATILFSLIRRPEPGGLPEHEERLKRLRQEEAGRRTMRRNLILIAGMLATLGIVTVVSQPGGPDPVSGLGVVAITLVPLFVWLFYGSEQIAREIEALRDQLFYETGQTTGIELRAERLFLLHRAELDRYYTETRLQSRWVFIAGVFAISFGAVIVITTVILVYLQLSDGTPATEDSPVLTALLGGVTGILTQFVGAIILRMYDQSAKSFGDFHRRLVQTNYLYFANLLTSKIQTLSTREAALQSLAGKVMDVEVKLAGQVGEPETGSPTP